MKLGGRGTRAPNRNRTSDLDLGVGAVLCYDDDNVFGLVFVCFDRYYKPLIRTKATSPISLPARQTVFQLKTKSRT